MYGDGFLDRAAELHGGYDADLMATLTEFTARSIALSFARFVPPVDEVIAAGGGVCNPVLFARLAALLSPAKLRTERRARRTGRGPRSDGLRDPGQRGDPRPLHINARGHRRVPPRRAGQALFTSPLS